MIFTLIHTLPNGHVHTEWIVAGAALMLTVLFISRYRLARKVARIEKNDR